jgi:GNAT superfamily N-acetyltransferase
LVQACFEMMQIRRITPAELAWVNAQYSSIDFVLSTESDFTVVAEIDGVKAGLGRIVQVDLVSGELGGMFVLPEFRGHSIATRLVEFLLEYNEYPNLFCVPFKHLEMFYQRFGFLPVDPSLSLPSKIAQKTSWCKTTYKTPVTVLFLSK